MWILFPNLNDHLSGSKMLPVFGSLSEIVGVLLALASLSLTACVANVSHRPESIDEGGPETIAFIELDDQGELWDPAQLRRATALIDEANRHPEGATVVLFVHGWNHNASPEDDLETGNIAGFRNILRQFALQGDTSETDSPRRVIGVYVGWRGKVLKPKLLRPLTFFNRRGAALRVSGPSSTELVFRVATSAKRNPASKVVLIGHSFGGLILERAVTQAMIGAVLDRSSTQERAFPADVVVLLNPASQAIYAKQFIEALQRERVRLFRTTVDGHRYERPLVVSVTSEADSATGRAFPTGLTLRSVGKNFRRYEEDSCVPLGKQKTFYRRTAGHSPVLRSHEVRTALLDSDESLERHFGSVRTELDPVTREPRFSFRGENHLYTIQRRPRSLNDSPYWILQVDKSMIPDHSTIFGNDTVLLLGALMAITGALEKESTTVFERLEGVTPIELAIRADNVPIVLDRSRIIYTPDSEGVLRSGGCIPQEIDAADRIGLDFGPEGGRAIVNYPRKGGKKGGYETEILSIQLVDGRPVIAGRRRLDSQLRFVTGAVDFSSNRAFLASETPGQIWWADLTSPTPRPELAASFESQGPFVSLALDSDSARLFLSDGLTSKIFGLDTQSLSTTTQVEDAGWPVSNAYDPSRKVLFTIDAQSKEVVERDCPTPAGCVNPRTVDLAGFISEPTFIRAGSDGVLWVAGLFENTVVARRSDGSVERIAPQVSPRAQPELP